jgi:hypothetical protein
MAGVQMDALLNIGKIAVIGGGIIFAIFVLLAIAGFFLEAQESRKLRRANEEKLNVVEQRVLDEPGKPQLAWDLARAKLENYLDRNLSQVSSILWLTYIVMVAGFSLILYGLYKSFDSSGSVTIAVVGSASGVIISFIGGSFLLIYKSIIEQSSNYVSILERINAVGMAVQVLSGIPDDQAELKHKTTAQLASDLIKIYSVADTKMSNTRSSTTRRVRRQR